MKVLKKTGQILLCPLPLLLTLLLQVTVVFVVMIALTFRDPWNADPYTLFMERYDIYMLLTQVITFLLFFLWYFLAYGRKRSAPPLYRVFHGKDLGVFVLLSIGIYSLTTIYMGLSSVVTPDLMEEYQTLVEETGLGDLTFLSTLSTLLMAPLSEEIIFRGITMNLSKKAFRYFWLANIIQAVLFGIAHMNWIQGSYAFFLGLALGYVCETYHYLFAGMLLHLLYNFMGTYGASLLSLLPLPDLAFYPFMLAVGLPATIFCLLWLRKKKNPPPSPAYWTGEPMD